MITISLFAGVIFGKTCRATPASVLATLMSRANAYQINLTAIPEAHLSATKDYIIFTYGPMPAHNRPATYI